MADIRNFAVGSFCVAMLASPAGAVTLLHTSADHYIGGVFVDGDDDTGNTSSFAAIGPSAAYSNSDGVLNVSSVTGSNSGGGGVAMRAMAPPPFPAPAHAETYTTLSSWENVIYNNTGTSVDYKYIFHVSRPHVGIIGNAGDFAALSLNIMVDGGTVYSAFISLDNNGLSYDPVLPSPHFADSHSAYFPSFDASASLGTYAAGASFKITYELKAYAEAGATGGVTLFGLVGGGESVNEYNFAIVGDPANPEGTPLQIIATVVPEPAAVVLFIMGLMGVGLRRRRSC